MHLEAQGKQGFFVTLTPLDLRALRKPVTGEAWQCLHHSTNTDLLPRAALVFLGTSQGSRWDSALPFWLMKSLELE